MSQKAAAAPQKAAAAPQKAVAARPKAAASKAAAHPVHRTAADPLSWGTILGTGVGLIIRILIALAMIATVLIDALVW